MQNRASISVVIPTYNRALDLKNAVASVLAQTYRVAEILVCDDGSTDNSREIVEGMKSSRIRWIECGRNGRPAIPRNIGIAQASSEWVAFLDSDDEWMPNKLEKQLVFATDKRYNAVCSNAFRIVKGQAPSPYLAYDKSSITFNDLLNTNYVICSSMMVRRTLLNKAGLFPESEEYSTTEDYTLWLKIAASQTIGYLPEPLLNYLDNPTQSHRANYVPVTEQRKRIFTGLREWLNTSDVPDKNAYLELVTRQLEPPDRGSLKNLLKRIFKK